jgi:hypothetical protein
MDILVPVMVVVTLCIAGSIFPANHDIPFFH